MAFLVDDDGVFLVLAGVAHDGDDRVDAGGGVGDSDERVHARGDDRPLGRDERVGDGVHAYRVVEREDSEGLRVEDEEGIEKKEPKGIYL